MEYVNVVFRKDDYEKAKKVLVRENIDYSLDENETVGKTEFTVDDIVSHLLTEEIEATTENIDLVISCLKHLEDAMCEAGWGCIYAVTSALVLSGKLRKDGE